jgi:hypothetical protein
MMRENLVKAMITGRKQASFHPGIFESDAVGPLAYGSGALAIAGSVVAVQMVDPTAFDLQNARQAPG